MVSIIEIKYGLDFVFSAKFLPIYMPSRGGAGGGGGVEGGLVIFLSFIGATGKCPQVSSSPPP